MSREYLTGFAFPSLESDDGQRSSTVGDSLLTTTSAPAPTTPKPTGWLKYLLMRGAFATVAASVSGSDYVAAGYVVSGYVQ